MNRNRRFFTAITLLVYVFYCISYKTTLSIIQKNLHSNPSLSILPPFWVGSKAKRKPLKLKTEEMENINQSLTRVELQALAKSNGIRANLKSSEIILQLQV